MLKNSARGTQPFLGLASKLRDQAPSAVVFGTPQERNRKHRT